MSRIGAAFERLAAGGQRALVSYAMAGYPSDRGFLSMVRGMVRGGADIIELGFPFSDPLADGPVIQDAGTASLARGATVGGFLETVRKIRSETDVPLVMMTYSNILYRRGYSRFVGAAVRAGIDGFVIPDMSIEESGEYLAATDGRADAIFLVSPNTSLARIRRIAGASSGFLYLVAVYGTTGAGASPRSYGIGAVRRTRRQVRGRIPVGAGFGISTPADVRRYVRAGADAVIVGSAYLRLAERTPAAGLESKVAAFTRSLKRECRPH